MIYTVTINPSLDYVIHMDRFIPGEINKIQREEFLPGGKGVNVSIVLTNMGYENISLGFLAGFTGRQIETALRAKGCRTDFIHMDEGHSRVNIKLKAMEESEMNSQGPLVAEPYVEMLMSKLDQITEDDVLVLAGSVSAGLPPNLYEEILERIQYKNCKVVIDATGDLLISGLKYKPFLVKPNNFELGEVFGICIKDKEEVTQYAKKLQAMGAKNVLVSMAGDGAVLVDEYGHVHSSPAPKGTVVNSVGAGDSTVAGFICGYMESGSYERAFYTAIAAGSASAFSAELATEGEIKALLCQLIS